MPTGSIVAPATPKFVGKAEAISVGSVTSAGSTPAEATSVESRCMEVSKSGLMETETSACDSRCIEVSSDGSMVCATSIPCGASVCSTSGEWCTASIPCGSNAAGSNGTSTTEISGAASTTGAGSTSMAGAAAQSGIAAAANSCGGGAISAGSMALVSPFIEVATVSCAGSACCSSSSAVPPPNHVLALERSFPTPVSREGASSSTGAVVISSAGMSATGSVVGIAQSGTDDALATGFAGGN